MLPVGNYLQIDTEMPVQCVECDLWSHDLVVSNEVIIRDETNDELFFKKESTWGIDAVLRFRDCGHQVEGALADPRSVAWMLDKYESMTDGF